MAVGLDNIVEEMVERHEMGQKLGFQSARTLRHRQGLGAGRKMYLSSGETVMEWVRGVGLRMAGG